VVVVERISGPAAAAVAFTLSINQGRPKPDPLCFSFPNRILLLTGSDHFLFGQESNFGEFELKVRFCISSVSFKWDRQKFPFPNSINIVRGVKDPFDKCD